MTEHLQRRPRTALILTQDLNEGELFSLVKSLCAVPSDTFICHLPRCHFQTSGGGRAGRALAYSCSHRSLQLQTSEIAVHPPVLCDGENGLGLREQHLCQANTIAVIDGPLTAN